ncbi:Concanavalin A-like lectin/glucanases superfamily [uncultured Caudovirales phage]|uniref:Concanavalin A-like lectin/glucanases superfamily n=1 Tax=uncultured Caudovirales phage TaxID=2100421 RepID=A0A6J7WT99_9CAUD|nr:Concanavalin A-like lectin/glucanases superfamily [uncultured Caudovirales phage]
MARIRNNNGIIGPRVLTTSSVASGIGTMVEMQQAVGASVWPSDGTSAFNPEAQFYLNTILLHGDGSNGVRNNTFIDSSTNNASITRAGSATQGTFSPYSLTGWSNYFNGSTDYITSGSILSFGTGDFTVEGWFYPTTTGTNFPLFTFGTLNAATNLGVFYTSNGGNQTVVRLSTSGADTATATYIASNVWTHVAVVRLGGAITIYFNGVAATNSSTAGGSTNLTGTTMTVGWSGSTVNTFFPGYISNVRSVRGTAVYTSNFTPSTTPLTAITNTQILTCQSNRFIDTSTNAYTMTPTGSPSIQSYSPFAPSNSYGVSSVGGSAYFASATNDYLTYNMGTAFGTSNFTIEGWFYSTAASWSPQQWLWGQRVGNDTCPYLIFDTSGILYFCGDTTNYLTSSALKLNTWYHVAIVRNGLGTNNLTMYINGVAVSQSSTTQNFSYTGTMCFAHNTLSVGYYYTGFLSNWHIVQGTAVYTSAFTPPTSPVTAISGTQLLLNGTNAGIYDSTGKNNLITGSTAALSTSQSKFGGSSMYFDGTTNCGIYAAPSTTTTNPISASGALGLGDFTVECWVYPTASGGFQCFATNRNSAGGAGTWFFGLYTGTTQVVWYNAATSSLLSTALSLNTWQHVAVCRSSGTSKMFINGALTGTSSVADSSNYSVGVLSIGFDIVEASYPLNGYMDEFRITRYARYPTTFTPQTTAFLNR